MSSPPSTSKTRSSCPSSRHHPPSGRLYLLYASLRLRHHRHFPAQDGIQVGRGGPGCYRREESNIQTMEAQVAVNNRTRKGLKDCTLALHMKTQFEAMSRWGHSNIPTFFMGHPLCLFKWLVRGVVPGEQPLSKQQ